MGGSFETPLELISHAMASGRLGVLIRQLQKDYERANIPFPMHDPELSKLNPTEIYQHFRENLYYLLMEDFEGYLNLMYAADVREKDFRNIRPTDAVEVAGQVVQLLLEREWEKIELRERYEGTGGT